jgi:hypothetical protein
MKGRSSAVRAMSRQPGETYALHGTTGRLEGRENEFIKGPTIPEEHVGSTRSYSSTCLVVLLRESL